MVKKHTRKSVLKLTHVDVPATVGFVKEVREELRSEIRGVKEDLKKEIHEVKSEIHAVKSEIHEVKSEIHSVKAEQHGMKSQIQDVLTTVHRTQVIVEEQRSENRIVLDGLKTMMERQDRIEGDILDIRTTLRTLKPVAISQ